MQHGTCTWLQPCQGASSGQVGLPAWLCRVVGCVCIVQHKCRRHSRSCCIWSQSALLLCCAAKHSASLASVHRSMCCAAGPPRVAEVNLWEEQVPPGTLVVLSGRDALMAAPQVRNHRICMAYFCMSMTSQALHGYAFKRFARNPGTWSTPTPGKKDNGVHSWVLPQCSRPWRCALSFRFWGFACPLVC